MIETPKANRLHIGIFGKRNSGKSSLINAISGQEIALVSNVPGTTTDPVYRTMELLPIGPVVLIDTAGVDDEGEIGALRVKKTMEVMDKTDLAILVFGNPDLDVSQEKLWFDELKKRNIPVIGVANKYDIFDLDIEYLKKEFNIPFIKVSARERQNIEELKKFIWENAPIDFEKETILGDIVKSGDLVLLVAPQDIQAPKGRLILPQVQVIRDILDNDAMAFTVKTSELEKSLERVKPDLVITDSQVFSRVNSMLPGDVPLTSFSILMARYKGELKDYVQGARAIDSLKPGDRVLIAEACTHHALQGDIGRQKLPKWLEEKIGGKLEFVINAGVDFPDNLNEFKLVVHCGACMFNRKQMVSRILKCRQSGVPITNYGIAIAHLNGILEKVIRVFGDNL